jgi:uncharacterized membrane protein YdjX (TVP38/TMEM64 family)
VLANIIGMFPGTLMYVYFGRAAQSLTAIIAGETAKGAIAPKVFFYLGLVIAVIVTVFITRIARKALKEVISTGEADGEKMSKTSK